MGLIRCPDCGKDISDILSRLGLFKEGTLNNAAVVVTDRPNEATHDRGNGATGKRPIWGLGLASVLVHFTSFRSPYFW
jgi:hypothetical protein